jgi:hypothetical protein
MGTPGPAGPRLGSVAAVAGITVGLILVTLDGLAAKGIAEAWATAPAADQAAALQLVVAIVAGLIQATAGEPTTVTRVLTIVFPTVITLWLVEMNVLVLRKAPALERAIIQDP